MVKYINMLTALCPQCKVKGFYVKCSKNHLEKNHGLNIETPQEIFKKVQELTKEEKGEKKNDKKKRKSRQEKLELADSQIQPKIEILQKFLNHIPRYQGSN